MNCPACLSIMYNKDEIHKISPTKNRMNLHCWNYKNCSSRSHNENDYYGPYMQVITNDPDPWECVKYGFIIIKNNRRILLEGDFGYNFTVSKIFDKETKNWKEIKKIRFVQLSTGNDMHIQAINLSNKLTKLIPFI